MTVQDNRGCGAGWANTPITRELLDAWIAYLESAGNNKALGTLVENDGSRCALGWMEQVAKDQGIHPVSIPRELYNDIVRLNDIEQLSLPEIAVWVKENVEVTE